jgi:hypothetical protein
MNRPGGIRSVRRRAPPARRPRILPRAIVIVSLVAVVAACVARPADGTGTLSGSASAPVVSSSAPTPAATPAATPAPRAVPEWPAPSDPLDRAIAAGLTPETKESLAFHVHAHLDVFVDGQPVEVPAGIGINIDDPGVRKFVEADGTVGYGGIEGCGQPCISPLHTHANRGLIHTESPTPKPNTLGQFFLEWDVTLSTSCVGEYCSPVPIAFYINGEPYPGDPNAIELADRTEIAIVIGTPPARIPSTADYSGA